MKVGYAWADGCLHAMGCIGVGGGKGMWQWGGRGKRERRLGTSETPGKKCQRPCAEIHRMDGVCEGEGPDKPGL